MRHKFRHAYFIVISVIAIGILSSSDTKAVAPQINYQGKLTDSLGIAVKDSVYNITFSLHEDSTTGAAIWAENVDIETFGGLFTYELGTTSPLTPNLIAQYEQLYLQLKLSGTALLPRTKFVSSPYSLVSGNFIIGDDADSMAIVSSGNENSILFLNKNSGDTLISLIGTLGGDSSVVLPDDAINDDEILNEPGIAENYSINIVTLNSTVMSDMVTVTIYAPTRGYIVLHGKCYLRLSGTTGTNIARVQIDDSQGGPANFPFFTQAGLSGYVNTSNNYFPIYVTRTVFVLEGEHTYRLEGMALSPSPALAESWDHILNATFYPSGYGTVRLAPPNSDPKLKR